MRAAILLAALLAVGCDRGPLDSVRDTALDAAVWREDGRKIAAVLPRAIGSFTPSEGADAFATSYSTGPVFGASCTYADGTRQLVLRIESGNIKARAGVVDARPGTTASDSSFVAREVVVHGRPAVLRWSDQARTGEVSFLVDRRYLVEVRVAPSTGADEAVTLANTLDVAPLEALVLDGVTR